MFIPSVNNFGSGVYRCQMCCELIINGGFNAALICDDCNARIEASKMIESGIANNTNGLPTDNLLLDTYYTREIKISYSHNDYKFDQYFKAVMIPNKDNWLDEKIKESETLMKNAGCKNISFKMISEFREMDEYEITSYMNDPNTTIHFDYKSITLPLVLKKYAFAKGKTTDWAEFRWKLVNVFILLISTFITLSSILIFMLAIYSRSWVGFFILPLIALSAKSTYEAFEELKQ